MMLDTKNCKYCCKLTLSILLPGYLGLLTPVLLRPYAEPLPHLLTIKLNICDVLTGEIMLYSGTIITNKETYRLGSA